MNHIKTVNTKHLSETEDINVLGCMIVGAIIGAPLIAITVMILSGFGL